MIAVADTNLLVYRHDPADRRKQSRATELLRQGARTGSIALPWQVLVEFVAATTRSRGRRAPLLSMEDARIEAETFLSLFPLLVPDEEVLRLAIRGTAAYALPWFDALIWAAAERAEIPTLYTEDLQHDRRIGKVRIVNPFA